MTKWVAYLWVAALLINCSVNSFMHGTSSVKRWLKIGPTGVVLLHSKRNIKVLVRSGMSLSPEPDISNGRGNFESTTIVSPFEMNKESNAPHKSGTTVKELELSVHNVNKVLDEVRPYLVEDGGDVSVLSIDLEKRSIQLSLLGACSSCSSSTVSCSVSTCVVII